MLLELNTLFPAPREKDPLEEWLATPGSSSNSGAEMASPGKATELFPLDPTSKKTERLGPLIPTKGSPGPAALPSIKKLLKEPPASLNKLKNPPAPLKSGSKA